MASSRTNGSCGVRVTGRVERCVALADHARRVCRPERLVQTRAWLLASGSTDREGGLRMGAPAADFGTTGCDLASFGGCRRYTRRIVWSRRDRCSLSSSFCLALYGHGPCSKADTRDLLDFYASRLMNTAADVLGGFYLHASRQHCDPSPVFPLADPLSAWAKLDIAKLPIRSMVYIATTLITLDRQRHMDVLGFNPSSGEWSIAPGYGPYATSALILSAVPQAWTWA